PGGEFDMADDDNDGIYTITIEREIGFNTFYTYANGNCPDYSCKENITGQDCARPDNFNDRFLPPVMADTVINTCFAICSDSTDCSISSLRDQLVSNLFTLSPNPGLDYTMVEFSGSNLMATQIEVLDIQGKVVYKQEVPAGINDHRLDLNNWSEGIYLVMLRQGAAIGIQKLKVE
ncbi:MAG: T9SS type A sorting domain-containing protein, partial [Bacteroidota bacterium]